MQGRNPYYAHRMTNPWVYTLNAHSYDAAYCCFGLPA